MDIKSLDSLAIEVVRCLANGGEGRGILCTCPGSRVTGSAVVGMGPYLFPLYYVGSATVTESRISSVSYSGNNSSTYPSS